MSTIPDNPVDDTKPETAPAIPTTADQRAAHAAVNSAFAAAKTDVEALETGKEDAGTASAAVAAHDANALAHGGVESQLSAHIGAGGGAHADATTGASGFMSATDKTKLNGVEANANDYSHPNHTGEVTSTGDGAQVITAGAVTTAKLADNAVDNTKAADMAANTVKARSATTGDPVDLTEAAATDLGIYVAGDGLFGWKAGGALGRFTDVPGGVGTGTLRTVQENGGQVTDGDSTLDFRATGDASVQVTSQAGNVTRVTIDATAGSSGGGIGKGTPFVVGDLMEASSSIGDGESITTGIQIGNVYHTGNPPPPNEANTSTTPAVVGGNEADINMAKSGVDLPKRKLVGGANITLTQGADAITIAATAGGTGDMQSPATIAVGELYEAASTDGTQTARANILTANLATADNVIGNGNLPQGNGAKGLVDSTISASDVVTAGVNLTSARLTQGNGLKGLTATSINPANVLQSNAGVATGNIIQSVSDRTMADSGIPAAQLAREDTTNTFAQNQTLQGAALIGSPTGGMPAIGQINAENLLVDNQEVYHPGNPPPGSGGGVSAGATFTLNQITSVSSTAGDGEIETTGLVASEVITSASTFVDGNMLLADTAARRIKDAGFSDGALVRNDLTTQIGSGIGHTATQRIVGSGGIFQINAALGQAVVFTGTASTDIYRPPNNQIHMVMVTINAGQTVNLAVAGQEWDVRGTEGTGIRCALAYHDGTNYFWFWSQAA